MYQQLSVPLLAHCLLSIQALLTFPVLATFTIGTVELADPTGTDNAVIDASALTGKLTLGSSSADFKATNGDNVTVKLGSGTNVVDFGAAGNR